MVTGASTGAFVCTYFPNARGGATGWLPQARLLPMTVDPDPPSAAWVGAWSTGYGWGRGADLRLSRAGAEIKVEGTAVFVRDAEAGNVNDGEIVGRARPLRGVLEITMEDQLDDCRARLRLIGPYLVVADNGGCGGAWVSFGGVYKRGLPSRRN
ncbi:hypothetical protein [Phenylobacterium sp.]|uniref:hypothetical protein n=1 Tax=Phenylobacterium sp. TaxID=1871053 RepID=UPI002F942DF2